MPKFLTLSTCIVIFLFFNTSIYSQPTFQARTDFTDYYFRQITRAIDNDLLLAADPRSGNNFTISRITQTGHVKWSNNFSNSMFSAFGTLTLFATKDNGFLVVKPYVKGGFFSNPDSTIYFVIKCDSSGNVIWKKSIDVSEEGVSYVDVRICEAPDGSIYLVNMDIHNYFKVIKLTQTGELIWSKRFAFSSDMWFNLAAITAGRDNGLIIMITKVACESYCSYSYIQKFDKNGTTEWGGDIFITGAYSSAPLNVAFEGDRIEVLLDVQPDYRTRKYCYWTFNPDGSGGRAVYINYNIFALKDYFFKHNAYRAKGKIVNDYYDNHWLLNQDWSLLNVYNYYGDNFLHFSKYDSLNRICPDYSIPNFDKSTQDVEVTLYNAYFAESVNSVSVKGFEVSVTSATFPITTICSGPVSSSSLTAKEYEHSVLKKLEMHIYPNPVKDILYANGLNANANATLTIINTQGFTVKRIDNIKAPAYEINVSQLPKGTYYLKAEDKTGSTTQQFMKE